MQTAHRASFLLLAAQCVFAKEKGAAAFDMLSNERPSNRLPPPVYVYLRCREWSRPGILLCAQEGLLAAAETVTTGATGPVQGD